MKKNIKNGYLITYKWKNQLKIVQNSRICINVMIKGNVDGVNLI